MIAKKPVVKPKSKTTEAKANGFIRKGAASNGSGEPVPIMLKVPSDLLDWLTVKAVEDARPRTVYILRALQAHREKVERGE